MIGYFCGEGATSPTEAVCGGAGDIFCPEGSFAPSTVSAKPTINIRKGCFGAAGNTTVSQGIGAYCFDWHGWAWKNVRGRSIFLVDLYVQVSGW